MVALAGPGGRRLPTEADYDPDAPEAPESPHAGRAMVVVVDDRVGGRPDRIGPLVTESAAKGIQAQIDDAVNSGAEVVVGGTRPDGPGAYVTPTVLAGVTPRMRAWSEEIFGPVAVMYRAKDEDDAVRIANDTLFGLGASVHSGDVDAALRVADRLESGMVSINEAPGSSSELPFGGVKRSGFGRELGTYGFDEFCNHRMIRIAG